MKTTMKTTPEIKPIYQAAKMLGVEIASHESDLYLPVNEVTRQLVAQHPHKENVTTFTNQIDGKRWYDIPFAYLPFWEKKNRKPFGWFILHRTGGVWSTFEGDLAAAEAECARLNETDEEGTTTIQAGFATRQECEAEFYRLNG